MDERLSPQESRLRSIMKAVTYRIAGTVTTFLITYAITDEFVTAMAVGGIEPAVKMIVYYAHERAWQNVPHGTIRAWRRVPVVRLKRSPR